jgi:NADPH-dependent curcumin reductase CurA
MAETARVEGHSAIVHTAAASNLGQMLVRICRADGLGLVNVVRSDAQVALLREAGAEHVVNSAAATFAEDLTAAITATGASIGFDAVGGGTLTNSIIKAMEAAALARSNAPYTRYGSDVFKQMYIYGTLDGSPTTLERSYGYNWAVSGFLVSRALKLLGAEKAAAMRKRVLAEARTTFASRFTGTIGLEGFLDAATMAKMIAKATGQKYLLNPRQ